MVVVAVWAVGNAVSRVGYLNLSPYGSIGQVFIAATLGLAFGYYLALAMAPGQTHHQASVFLSTLFGAFVIMGLYVAGSYVVGTSLSIPGFDGTQAVPTIFLLLAMTILVVAFVRAGLTDTSQLKSIGKVIPFYARRLAPSLLGGYASASLTGSSALIVGVGITLTLFIVTIIVVALGDGRHDFWSAFSLEDELDDLADEMEERVKLPTPARPINEDRRR